MTPIGSLSSLTQLRDLVRESINSSSAQLMANAKIKRNRLTGKEKIVVWGSCWTSSDEYSRYFCIRLIKEVKGTPWSTSESQWLRFPQHFLLGQNKDLRTREIKTFINGVAEPRVSLGDALIVLNKAIDVIEKNQLSTSLPQSIWEPA